MERASGRGCWTERPARPSCPGKLVFCWHGCPVYLQCARLVGELVPRVALPLPSGPRFPCQQQLSHLSRGEQGLQGLWSPETEGVLDQGWPCKSTPSLRSAEGTEFLGTGGPGTPDPPSSRPFVLSLGKDPAVLRSPQSTRQQVQDAWRWGSWFLPVSFPLVLCGSESSFASPRASISSSAKWRHTDVPPGLSWRISPYTKL